MGQISCTLFWNIPRRSVAARHETSPIKSHTPLKLRRCLLAPAESIQAQGFGLYPNLLACQNMRWQVNLLGWIISLAAWVQRLNACSVQFTVTATDKRPSFSSVTHIAVVRDSSIYVYSTSHLPKWLIWQRPGQQGLRGQCHLGFGSCCCHYSGV